MLQYCSGDGKKWPGWAVCLYVAGLGIGTREGTPSSARAGVSLGRPDIHESRKMPLPENVIEIQQMDELMPLLFLFNTRTMTDEHLGESYPVSKFADFISKIALKSSLTHGGDN